MGLPDSEGRDGQFEPIRLNGCDSSDCLGVTLRPLTPTHVNFLLTIPLLTPAGDQLVAEGVTHTRIRSGGQEKIKQTNKHEQSLGLTKSRGRYCNTSFPCAD